MKAVLAFAVAAFAALTLVSSASADGMPERDNHKVLLQLCRPGTVTEGMKDELNAMDEGEFAQFVRSCMSAPRSKVTEAPPPAPPVVAPPPAPALAPVRTREAICYLWVAVVEKDGTPYRQPTHLSVLNIEGALEPVWFKRFERGRNLQGGDNRVPVPCAFAQLVHAELCLNRRRTEVLAEQWFATARRYATAGQVLNPDKPIVFRRRSEERQTEYRYARQCRPDVYGGGCPQQQQQQGGRAYRQRSSYQRPQGRWMVGQGSQAGYRPAPQYQPRPMYHRPPPMYRPPMMARPFMGGMPHGAIIGPGPGPWGRHR